MALCVSVAGALAGYLLFDKTAHLFCVRPTFERLAADHSNEELLFLVTILREKDVTGLNTAINRTRDFAQSPIFTHKLVVCMRFVRLSVILHQQSRLSSGAQ